jgi:hypothetical protein
MKIKLLNVNCTYILVNKIQATIIRNEGSDLLPVFDELHADSLSNGRVGLFGLKSTKTRLEK